MPLKIMTVELAEPFQWPEVPKNLEPWSNELWTMREDLMQQRSEDQVRAQRFESPLKSRQPLSKERKELGNLAQQMLSGQVEWTNGATLDPKWDDIVAQVKKSDQAAGEVQAKEEQPRSP